MRRGAAGLVATMLTALLCAAGPSAQERAPVLESGSAFLSPELKALEADAFANPGMLWVEEGERLWAQVEGAAGKSCATCHSDAAESMKGVATRYPAMDAASGRLLNLENRINACRARHMSAEPLSYESNALLSLTAYLARQSLGMPVRVETGGAAAPWYARGEALFTARQGQLNLACGQCHVERVGAKLRGDVISHGLGVGYPVYRLEWQGLGSLHRRLRACTFGVRAIHFDSGSDEYVSLELYLAKRAEGLPVQAPAMRK
jgi:sulfur-oxidizing protein SoxA